VLLSYIVNFQVLTECLGIPDIHCISATLYATALLLLQSKDAYITVL